MNIHNIELEQVAGRYDQFPADDIPEVAFVGKSNVGKSSLLNTLANRKKLARTSGQPGKTRTINFYNVDNILRLVDLPGYGYAKVGRKEQEKWEKLSDEYLNKRKQLKCVVLLIDIRRESSELDRMMYEYVRYTNRECLVIATKSDKLKRSQVKKALMQIRKKMGITEDKIIIPFSSTTKDGKDEVWNELGKYV